MSQNVANRPLVVAHRGASSGARENSLEAFELAINLGAHMVEFDVRRTLDGRLVAHHDPSFNGTLIRDALYGDLAQNASNKAGLASLDQIVELCRDRIGLDVELKEEGYEEDVLNVLLSRIPAADFVVTSFSDRTVASVKSLHPNVRAGLLLGQDRPANPIVTRGREVTPFRRLAHCHADFVAPHFKLLELGLLWRAGRRGIPVYVWTVNEPDRIRKYMNDPRIEAIITDVPGIALGLRDV